ncbi:MAG TPA: glyoxalase/bleomycin resistance/extradiol dioxygenase family protein [Candidatus Hydrogenedentes bacterium]|nr:glyoxalase/bleomycin resistance/extradiol dioxygenase family protein [Candidatus Hydrogenedentota bacterium]
MGESACKRPGMQWVSPYLVVQDVRRAIAFYEEAFGLKARMVYPESDPDPFYAELDYEGMTIMIGLPRGRKRGEQPVKTRAGSSLYCYTPDVDALCERARAAGAKVAMEPAEQFWGDRACLLADPDGHAWMWATHVRDFDPVNGSA